jgi:hypothetical protein
MVKVTERYTSRVLNGMLLEAIKNLNIVRDALDPAETKVVAQIEEITKQISRIEV